VKRLRLLVVAALLSAVSISCVSDEKGRYGEGCGPSTSPEDSDRWPKNVGYQTSRIDVGVDDAQRLLDSGNVSEARRRLVELPTGLEDGRVHMLYARIAMAEGRPTEVEIHLDEAGKLLPLEGRVDLMRATFKEIYGEWAAARQAYAEAARKMPDSLEPIVAQARVLLALQLSDKALELMEREMATRPLSGEMLRTAGFVYLSAGDSDAAARAFRDAQDLLPAEARTLETMFLALARAGRYADVVELASDMTVEELSPLCQYTVAQSALLAEDAALAVEAMQHYVNQERGDPEAWLVLARAHFMDDQHDAAFEVVTKVLRTHPDHLDALVLLGHIRSRVGQYEAAMATYREAARLGADGVELAPVMLALVDALEYERTHPTSADQLAQADTSAQVVQVPAGASSGVADSRQPAPVATRDPDPTPSESRATPVETPVATPREPMDPRRAAELLAGTRSSAPEEPAPVVPEPVVPVVPERLMPALHDAGPAARELMSAPSGLDLPTLPTPVVAAAADPDPRQDG